MQIDSPYLRLHPGLVLLQVALSHVGIRPYRKEFVRSRSICYDHVLTALVAKKPGELVPELEGALVLKLWKST